MSDNFNSDHEELFHELSLSEQESISAGQGLNLPGLGSLDLFLQNTIINTDAENDVNLGGSDSSSQNSEYDLYQLTLGASLKFLLPNSNNPQWNDTLANIANRIFS